MEQDEFPVVTFAESRREMVEHAIMKAVRDGWAASPGSFANRQMPNSMRSNNQMEWTIASIQYDLGHYEVRLTEDLRLLMLVHSTDIHCFPPAVEEASLIRLDAFTPSGLSTMLRELMEKRRPNLVHPT